MTSMQSPEPPRGKTDYVYEWLRDRIMSGALSPGEPIRQNSIAKQLGVSASPVREAFRRLESVGLISHTANLGASVAELSENDLHEVYLLRGVMEGLAAGLASKKRSEADLKRLSGLLDEAEALIDRNYEPADLAKLSREFHDEVSRIGSPDVIAPRIQQLWFAFPIPQRLSLWADRDLARVNLQLHRKLYRAIERGDSVTAERIGRDHVHATGRHRIKQLQLEQK